MMCLRRCSEIAVAPEYIPLLDALQLADMAGDAHIAGGFQTRTECDDERGRGKIEGLLQVRDLLLLLHNSLSSARPIDIPP